MSQDYQNLRPSRATTQGMPRVYPLSRATTQGIMFQATTQGTLQQVNLRDITKAL